MFDPSVLSNLGRSPYGNAVTGAGIGNTLNRGGMGYRSAPSQKVAPALGGLGGFMSNPRSGQLEGAAGGVMAHPAMQKRLLEFQRSNPNSQLWQRSPGMAGWLANQRQGLSPRDMNQNIMHQRLMDRRRAMAGGNYQNLANNPANRDPRTGEVMMPGRAARQQSILERLGARGR